MLRVLVFLMLPWLLFSLSGCVPSDPVIDSLPPYESKVMFTSGGFQDYTDYGKYTFPQLAESALQGNPYLKKVTAEDLTILQAYLDNFEDWIETHRRSEPQGELVLGYDFDRAVLAEGDYYFIDEAESKIAFSNYDIYYFDTETNILYFFHNNI